MQIHKCTHGKVEHECYHITEDEKAPPELLGECIAIPNEMSVLWATEVVSVAV
jgi:hypothetical protein